jgi:hypothetical protein
MIVALTYDHRLLDGREAVTFLGEWDLSVAVLVLPDEQPADVMLVAVGTNSESEGVHRGPSQDAIGIMKLALRSFLSFFCCCDSKCNKARLKRRIARKRRVDGVSWMDNCRTWLFVAMRTLFFARLARNTHTTYHGFLFFYRFALQWLMHGNEWNNEMGGPSLRRGVPALGYATRDKLCGVRGAPSL